MSSTGTGGSTASVYGPQFQNQVDTGILGPGFTNIWQPVATDLGATPAGQVYPQAQTSAQMAASNPQFDAMLMGAMFPGQDPFNIYGMGTQGAGALTGAGTSAAAAATNPYYGAQVNEIAGNPFYQSYAVPGALQGYSLGTAGANVGLAGVPLALGGAPQLYNAGTSILNTAFDPQQQLYNQTANQVSQQQEAALASAGLGSTPYGASVAGNTMGNFNIDWQNQQLARMTQGAQAAASLFPTAANLDYTAGTTMGQLGQQAYQAGQLPTQAMMGQLGAEQQIMGGQNTAAATGLPAAVQALGGGQSVYGQALGNLLGGTQSGYNAYNTQSTNAMNALNSLVNLGNNQYLLPQQAMNLGMNYLGLGQQASQISGNLGQMGQNQLSQSMSGLGSLGALAAPMAMMGS